MEKIFWSIDVDAIHAEEEIRYEIGGWAMEPGVETIKLILLADDHREIPCTVTVEERPDVQAAMADMTERTDIGFHITVPDLDQLWERYEKMTLWLYDGENRIKALEYPMKEIRQRYYEMTLTWEIDQISQEDDEMTICGWVIGLFHDEQVFLCDEQGKEIPAKLIRILRLDVNETYQLGEEFQEEPCGFQFQVQRDQISCASIHVKFQNRFITKEYVIDLKKFDYENSKWGRLMKMLALENRKENMEYIKEYGVRGFVNHVRRQLEPVYTDYNLWVRDHRLTKREIIRQRASKFAWSPKISVVVPLYNTPEHYLKEMLDSLLNQTYSNLEICLADGSSDYSVREYLKQNYGREKRIRYRKLKKNRGIAMNTNAALKLATGDFIMLADHDDVVARNALYEMVKVLNWYPDLDVIYTDEDKVTMNGKQYYDPKFKSDFNLDLLRSVNYICHIFLARRSLVDAVGGFRKEFDGAQDYDFILRCIEKTDRIYHIPKVLYHWRAHPDSTAGNPESKQYAYDAGRNALEQHYKRMGIEAKVEDTGIFCIYRTIYQVQKHPMVSVIIPNKDHRDDLEKCVVSIIEKTTYDNYEILVVENNSEDSKTFVYYEDLKKRFPQVRVITWEGGFNYAALNNFGVSHAKGEYLLLLNNDVEVISPAWMEEMLGCAQREEVGIVGAKLFYPDDTIQHAGVVLGIGGIAGHVLCKANGDEYGYNGRLVTMQDISAVTAACLMIPKAEFQAVGGFDERLVVAFNDVDLCMKVRKRKKLVVFNPYVTLYHYESKSRGYEDTPEKQERFQREKAYFQKKWRAALRKGDPYYNVNLTLTEGDCSLRKATEELEIE